MCVLVRYASAEVDCTEALVRDAAYVKAFGRRAAARVALQNYSGAHDDYRRVLELEPTNRLAQTELKAVEQASDCDFCHCENCALAILLRFICEFTFQVSHHHLQSGVWTNHHPASSGGMSRQCET